MKQEPLISEPARLHRRQFVAGPEPFNGFDDWLHLELSPKTWLSYSPDLRVSQTMDAQGVVWTLLGLAVQTLEGEPGPIEAISQNDTDSISKLHDSWAGRWLLIGNGQVNMDCLGALGCFYGQNSAEQTWISSSPALLREIIVDSELIRPDPRQLRYERGISWITPPDSRIDGIFRLLPSQLLLLDNGRIIPRTLLPPIDQSRRYEETLDRFFQSQVIGLRNLAGEGGPLWMSLTSGGDSRLILAAAHTAQIEMKTFTRTAGRMSVADLLLPPEMARDLGYEHIVVGGGRRIPGRLQMANQHAEQHVSKGDIESFLHGHRDSLDGIIFGGHAFGLGKCKYRDTVPMEYHDPLAGAKAFAFTLGEPRESSAVEGLGRWLEWVDQTPVDNLDWRDRFYIEQRCTGWLSAKEQVYDMQPSERFMGLNSARAVSLLLSLPENRRVKSKYQIDIIRNSVPQLLNYPINPPDRHFGFLRAITIRLQLDPRELPRRAKFLVRDLMGLD